MMEISKKKQQPSIIAEKFLCSLKLDFVGNQYRSNSQNRYGNRHIVYVGYVVFNFPVGLDGCSQRHAVLYVD